MTCPACESTEIGRYQADCDECHCRLLARSPAFYEASQANAMTPRYRDALIARWGGDWLKWHEKVKAYRENT